MSGRPSSPAAGSRREPDRAFLMTAYHSAAGPGIVGVEEMPLGVRRIRVCGFDRLAGHLAAVTR